MHACTHTHIHTTGIRYYRLYKYYTHTHTFHEFDALSDVILILALDEVPGISELDLISEAILSDTLTIRFLVSLKEQQTLKRPILVSNFIPQ